MVVEAEDEGPAVRALGSLLKLTQVFLWDDGTRNDRSFSLGQTKPARDEGDDGSNALSSECGTLPEDMELTRQMNELGLPVSFRTNKEKQKRTTQGKRKGMRQKHSNESQQVVGGALDSSKVSVEEIVSPIIFDDKPSSSLCCMSMMGQSESSSSDVAADANNPASSAKITGDSRDGIVGIFSNEGQDCDSLHNGAMLTDATTILASSTGLDAVLYPGSCSADAANGHDKTEPGERLMEHDHVECAIMATSEAEITESCEEHVPEPCVSESVSCSIYPEGLENDAIDSQQSGDFGDWMVYWDSYYMRNYFYNIRTHTSTWYPPVGMEHLENVDSTYKSNEGVAGVTQMDVTTDLKATDLCVLSKFDSFEEPINVDVLQYQRYEEVSRDVENTAANTLSDTSTSTVSVSICPELPDELNQSNNRCNDGNASCLSSNVQDHIASCRNQTMEQVADEVCNSDLQPIFAGKSAEPDISDLYDKPNEVDFCEEIPKYGEHDEAIQTLDTSSMSNSCTEEVEDWNRHSETGVPATNELEMKSDPALVKRKKKVRRIQSHRKFFNENEEVLFEGLLKKCSTDIGKYWSQRYLLFSRYDDGIKMDEEGWFSVTPEALAMHHAQRCGSGIIIDCFTGVGGNAIQFAQISKHVTAIDIDPTKIDYAQHNAAIYGVDERIDFIKGDFFHLASRLKADTVFLSPPWGGPGYAREETYDIMTMLKPHDGYFLFNTAKQVASKIVMFLPRNVDVNQLAELSLSGTPPWSLEVEKNFVNGKLKGITAYFSDTARRE